MSASPLKIASPLVLAGATLLLAACGGGGSGSADDSAETVALKTSASTRQVESAAVHATTVKVATPAGGTYTLQQRIAAANAVAKTHAYCTALHPFYWEIGDKSGMQASGTGGGKSPAPPNASTPLHFASASKWLFSTYVVEKQQGVLSTADIKRLNFTSGYTNLDRCSPTSTVSSCLSETGLNGGFNGSYNASADGRFDYNAGHMQVLADHIGLGQSRGNALAGQLQAILGSNLAFHFGAPVISGGAVGTPAAYAQFLRNMLGGRYPHMRDMLGSHAVCTHANSADCPSALYNPINQSAPGAANDVGNEAAHYSLGHWVEDDPAYSDGAFSSPGKFSFYPWIDRSKTYYGVLATIDAAATTQVSALPGGVWPLNCGRLIRRAWLMPDAPVKPPAKHG